MIVQDSHTGPKQMKGELSSGLSCLSPEKVNRGFGEALAAWQK